jgi:four helix bundle protein
MGKPFDLHDRTEEFAKNVRVLVRNISKDIANLEDSKQLVRSSGSVAANYIEANEAFSRRDFSFRIKICRKEAKESKLWLNLLLITDSRWDGARNELVTESSELVKIFSAILSKVTPVNFD